MTNLTLADGLVKYLNEVGELRPSLITRLEQNTLAKICDKFHSIPSIGMQLRKLHQAGKVSRHWDRLNPKLKVYSKKDETEKNT